MINESLAVATSIGSAIDESVVEEQTAAAPAPYILTRAEVAETDSVADDDEDEDSYADSFASASGSVASAIESVISAAGSTSGSRTPRGRPRSTGSTVLRADSVDDSIGESVAEDSRSYASVQVRPRLCADTRDANMGCPPTE